MTVRQGRVQHSCHGQMILSVIDNFFLLQIFFSPCYLQLCTSPIIWAKKVHLAQEKEDSDSQFSLLVRFVNSYKFTVLINSCSVQKFAF